MHASKADVTDAAPVVEMQVTYELCAPALGRFENTVREAPAAGPGVLVVDLSRCPGIDAAVTGTAAAVCRHVAPLLISTA